jgi:transposase
VEAVPAPAEGIDAGAALPLTLPEKAKLRNRERRLTRYDEVIALWGQDVSLRAVARELHLSRNTVKKFVRAGSFPEQAQRARRRSTVDPYGEYLARRWAEGCHNATTLWDEIRGQGFSGAYSAVCRYLARWWRHNLPLRLQRRKRSKPVTTIKTPSARSTMWLLLGDEANRKADEQSFVTRLVEDCQEVAAAQRIARRFIAIIRGRQAEALDEWMAEAAASGLPEVRGFVSGLRRDLAAVRAALE